MTDRKTLLDRAAKMRARPTEPERLLWMQLRASRFLGHKFRRQTAIENRIADFFCPAKGLVIEIDGDTRDCEFDRRKDTRLQNRTGFRVLRFTNHEVVHEMESVLERLKAELERQPDRWPGDGLHHPPAPSSEEEGE